MITSYLRTIEKQTEIVWADSIKYPSLPNMKALYTSTTGKGLRKLIDSNTNHNVSSDDIIDYLEERIEGNSGFAHVIGNGGKALDTGANNGLDPRKQCFVDSLAHIQSKNTIINTIITFLKKIRFFIVDCSKI